MLWTFKKKLYYPLTFGDPYDSGECMPFPEDRKCTMIDEEGNTTEFSCPRPDYKFKPELVSDCIATVKVTKNLKGGLQCWKRSKNFIFKTCSRM
jgi:hypothetical protein